MALSWTSAKMVTPEEDGTPAVENIGLGGWGGSCHKRRWAVIRAHILGGSVKHYRSCTQTFFFAPWGFKCNI